MQRSDAGYFAGPSAYDRCLGPLLFEPYAAYMAERLSDLRSGAVLEIAAGTGIATQALDRALPPDVSVVATDLTAGMIELAATKGMSSRVRFEQADAMALPFVDGSFDAVLCQFGVMFFPDTEAAFRETLRVLKSGGRFVFRRLGRVGGKRCGSNRARSGHCTVPRRPSGIFGARTVRSV